MWLCSAQASMAGGGREPWLETAVYCVGCNTISAVGILGNIFSVIILYPARSQLRIMLLKNHSLSANFF